MRVHSCRIVALRKGMTTKPWAIAHQTTMLQCKMEKKIGA
jgi:hypothetical protein